MIAPRVALRKLQILVHVSTMSWLSSDGCDTVSVGRLLFAF